jgi:hypothetical protein
MRALALARKLEVLDFIRGLFRDAGAADPDRLTHKIALLIDGAIVAVMITRDPAIGLHAQHAFARLLKAERWPRAVVQEASE